MKFLTRNSNYEKYYQDILPYFKNEKTQKYFAIILTISASIFFFLFAINPTLSTIAKLKRQITDSKIVEGKLSQKINNLSSLSQAYESAKGDIPLIMDAIPQSANAPTLVGQIQSLAQQSSVNISSINVSPVNLSSQSSSTSSTFGFEVTGKSTYDNLQKFLSNLVNMQRAVSINSIQMSKSIDSGDIEMVIKGQAYFKKL